METSDITIEILKDIRSHVGHINERLEETNERLEQTNERIDGTNERLDALHRRVVESEIRTATAITDLAGTVQVVADMLRASNDLRPRVENCERDILDLKHRLP
jgi:chromosome segregation ATPase